MIVTSIRTRTIHERQSICQCACMARSKYFTASASTYRISASSDFNESLCHAKH